MAIVLMLAYRADRIDEVEKGDTDEDHIMFERIVQWGFKIYSTVLEYLCKII